MIRLLALFGGIGIGLYSVSLHSSLFEITLQDDMDKLIAILKRHEGVKHFAYRDS